MHCFVFVFKPNTRDFLNPIQLQLTYDLPERKPPSSGNDLPQINDYPILDKTQAELITEVCEMLKYYCVLDL